MPFQPVENTALAELIFTAFGVTFENNLTFERTSGEGDISTAECSTIASNVKAWAEEFLMPVLALEIVLDRVEVKGLDIEAPTFASSVSGTAGGGSAGSEPLPTTCCVSFRSGFSGRNFRGRNYVSGIPSGLVSGNTISTQFTDDLSAAYNALLSAEPLGFNWVVVSRVTGGLLRPFGVTTPISSIAITSNLVTHMDSRKT